MNRPASYFKNQADEPRVTRVWTALDARLERRRGRQRWSKPLALACGAVAVAVLAWSATHPRRANDPAVLEIADGSRVEHPRDARVEVMAVTPDRVELRITRGRAQFSVRPNRQRSFLTHAGEYTVRVVGTVFSVELEPSGLQVGVTRGEVEVRRDGTNDVWRIRAGEHWTSNRVSAGMGGREPTGAAQTRAHAEHAADAQPTHSTPDSGSNGEPDHARSAAHVDPAELVPSPAATRSEAPASSAARRAGRTSASDARAPQPAAPDTVSRSARRSRKHTPRYRQAPRTDADHSEEGSTAFAAPAGPPTAAEAAQREAGPSSSSKTQPPTAPTAPIAPIADAVARPADRAAAAPTPGQPTPADAAGPTEPRAPRAARQAAASAQRTSVNEATTKPDAAPARAAASDEPAALFQRAQQAREAAHPEEAARLLAQFLQLAPHDPRAGLAAFQLARTRLDLGDPRGALEALDAATRAGSAFTEQIEARRVQALEQLGQTAACRQARTAYLHTFPDGAFSAMVRQRCP